jgi:hypothetical protein
VKWPPIGVATGEGSRFEKGKVFYQEIKFFLKKRKNESPHDIENNSGLLRKKKSRHLLAYEPRVRPCGRLFGTD